MLKKIALILFIIPFCLCNFAFSFLPNNFNMTPDNNNFNKINYSQRYKVNKRNNNLSEKTALSGGSSLEYSDVFNWFSTLNWDKNKPNIIMNFIKDLNPEKNYIDIINNNRNKIKPTFVDIINEHNSKNIMGWNLVLHSAFWNNMNLKELSFLSKLNNINSIILKVDNDFIRPEFLGETFDLTSLKELRWINNLSYINDLEILFSSRLNDGTRIKFSDFAFLNDNFSIQKLNIKSFIGESKENIIDGNLLDEEWFINKKINFEIYLPNTFNAVSNDDILVENVKNSTGEYIIITKNSLPPLESPTWQDNESVIIDGEIVEAKIINGIWYWNVEDPDILKNINWAIIERREYFTSKDKPSFAKKVLKSNHDQKLSKKDIELQLIKITGNNIPLNRDNIDVAPYEKMIINEKEYGRYIVDSHLYWDFDISRIKYAYINADGKKAYSTEFSNIPPSFLSIISSVSKEYDNSFKQKKYAKLNNPNKYSDILRVDKKNIYAMIRKGKFYWNFENANIDLDKLVYSSSKNNYAVTSLSNFKDLPFIPDDINYFDKDLEWHKLGVKVTDGEILTLDLLKKFEKENKQIIIDDKSYDQLIYDGRIYYDAPIEKIKYEFNDGKTIKYYTSWDYIKSMKIDIAFLSELNSLEKHNKPPHHKVEEPDQLNMKSKIIIDGSEFGVSLRSGKIFWSEEAQRLITKIKYVDKFRGFYTTIVSNLPKGLSQVDKVVEYNIDPQISNTIIQGNISSKEKIIALFNGIYINRKKYKIYFLDSKILIEDNENEIKYVFKFKDPLSNQFFSDKKYIDNLFIKKNSEIDTSLISLSEVDLEIMPEFNNPTSENQTIKIITKSGITLVIEAIKGVGGKLYWNDYEKAKNIKFIFKKDDEIYYATDLSAKNIKDNFTISSIVKNNTEKFVSDDEKKIEQKRIESKTIFYIVIGGLSAILIGVISYISIIAKKIRK